MQSINPATEEVITAYQLADESEIDRALERADTAFRSWRRTPVQERQKCTRRLATVLRERKTELSKVITSEMGKPIAEAEAEIEKCAWNCETYAEIGADLLANKPAPSAASESYVQFLPLGPILAIMPWNFPFWQVFRFAAPAVVAGNTVILKHASNVPGCSQSIAETFQEAGFPEGVFQSILVPGSAASRLIGDRRIAAVTLTGSNLAGSQAAAAAGAAIKKTVLELGGSDPFIILEDADLESAVTTGVKSRFQNTGQSCIAAKRFIVVEKIFSTFADRFAEAVAALKTGQPMERETQIGPLARKDLREGIEKQVEESVALGAQVLVGGQRLPGKGYFYKPTVLTDVTPTLPAGCEEVFGPVAALMRVRDDEEAIALANNSPFGLGSSLWTRDLDKARRLAREIEAGQVFINGMVASDPRLPFGGVKESGYGRELSEFGIREFVNIQTVWIK
ncbi:MAG: NAD-dependent succinate-semialdehyde dehydrogenase [Acidobacteria bacterium]|nr:MAG: NAD-dependent succinate-semialdehyde dehydrogenase [Acidobacteriota bacterium]